MPVFSANSFGLFNLSDSISAYLIKNFRDGHGYIGDELSYLTFEHTIKAKDHKKCSIGHDVMTFRIQDLASGVSLIQKLIRTECKTQSLKCKFAAKVETSKAGLSTFFFNKKKYM